MRSRNVLLRNPRTWTIVPGLIAVVSFAVGYLIWLIVGLDAGLQCRDATLTCGPGGWSALIAVLWTIAAIFGVIGAVGVVWLAGRSVIAAFANLRD